MFATEASARIFISYRTREPDLQLARVFRQALRAAGHQVFMASEDIRLGQDWRNRIVQELEQCDYFLLLLSFESAMSEMVTEEVRRAKVWQRTRSDSRPVMLPIRVNFPSGLSMNYDLDAYLQPIQYRHWRSPDDTPRILEEILRVIEDGSAFEPIDDPILSDIPHTSDVNHFPPVPGASPELPRGQVSLESYFYVERPLIEEKCYHEILNPGALIRIKAPRQMGKTSLMARILKRADEQEYRTVPLSFQLADGNVFADLQALLQWFCASVSWKLELPTRLEENLSRFAGAKVSCDDYFEKFILAQIDGSLVLGLDAVDRVFQYPEIAADFFRLLRVWNGQAQDQSLWRKLRLVVSHSMEVNLDNLPLSINESPFNVGLPIELPDFTPEAVQDLALRHGLNWNLAQVNQLMQMVGGHPFLVRLALYPIAQGEITLPELLEIAPTEAGPYGDHLRRHWWNLTQNPELAAAIRQIVTAPQPIQIEPMLAFKLHSMGLVDLQGNDVVMRCDLYRQYFHDRRSFIAPGNWTSRLIRRWWPWSN